jgi:hypothetical protein
VGRTEAVQLGSQSNGPGIVGVRELTRPARNARGK